jgi:hypothetical protein
MRAKSGKLALFLLCLGLTLLVSVGAVPQLLAKKKDKAPDPGPNEQKRAVHALNRLTFGPRPGDVQQVMAIGVDRWVDVQLHPEKIPDTAVESRLATFRTLHMSSKEIAEDFPDNQMIKQVMDGKRPMPSDPGKRAVFQVQIARLEERQEKKEQKRQAVAPAPVAPVASDTAKTAEELAAAAVACGDAAGNAAGNAPANLADSNSNSMSMNSTPASNSDGGANRGVPHVSPSLRDMGAPANEMATGPSSDARPAQMDAAEARRREDRLYADLKIEGLIDLPADQRYKKVLAMSVDEQLAFADSLRGGSVKAQDFVAGMNAKQKETLLAMNNPPAVVADQLVQAKLLRAIYSDRQL